MWCEGEVCVGVWRCVRVCVEVCWVLNYDFKIILSTPHTLTYTHPRTTHTHAPPSHHTPLTHTLFLSPNSHLHTHTTHTHTLTISPNSQLTHPRAQFTAFWKCISHCAMCHVVPLSTRIKMGGRPSKSP